MRVMPAGINEGKLDAAVARLHALGVAAQRVQCDMASRARGAAFSSVSDVPGDRRLDTAASLGG